MIRKALSKITPLRNLVQSYRNVKTEKHLIDLNRSKTYSLATSDSDEITLYSRMVQTASKKPYDVGIVGLWYGLNYGSILTYYALYELVEQLGYKAVMLQKPPQLWRPRYNDPDSIAQMFINERCSVGPLREKPEQMIEDNNLANTFVLGSDVVWNYEICGRSGGHYFFLDFVDGLNKKVSFASSLGEGMNNASDEYRNVASVYLRDFDALSVREIQAKEDLDKKFGVEATHVMDPVFLVRQSTYDEIADSTAPLSDKPYIMSYILGISPEKLEGLKMVKDTLGLELVPFGNPNLSVDIYDEYNYPVTEHNTVPDWLRGMRECEFFLGDSFHGMCYAIIFHRPFAIFTNRNHAGITRFKSLLSLTGLEDRLIFTGEPDSIENLMKIVETPIDWDEVDARLAPMKEASEKWLYDALSDQKPTFWEKHKLKKQEKQVEVA